MISDFDRPDTEVPAGIDVCIAGSGVAGLVLAHELKDSGLRVLVLEAGGMQISEQSQNMYRAGIVGAPYTGHLEGRFRVLGGTSTRWGGQLIPLDPGDLEFRATLNGSGWPIAYSEIEDCYGQVSRMLHADDLPYDDRLQKALKFEPLQFDADRFRFRYSKWIPFKYRNIASALGPLLTARGNTDVLVNAAVTGVGLDHSGCRVDGFDIRSPGGRTSRISARQYVLCCGTIETARILLASRDVNTRGVGNDNDLVGRYFQDHVSIDCAELMPVVTRKFLNTFSPWFVRDVMHSPRLELGPRALRDSGHLGCYGQVLADPPDDSGFVVVREILRRMQAKQGAFPAWPELRNALRELPYIIRLGKSRYIGGRLPHPPRCRWRFVVDVEQEPNPDSRVLLTGEQDSLGMPGIAINWQIGERERASAAYYMESFRSEWERLGLGTADWSRELTDPGRDWLGSVRDTFHQVGTTRMGDDPATSVVNTDLRVHGVDNLYIGSAAVFPTSGSANPTFTLAALCVRMARHLRGRLR